MSQKKEKKRSSKIKILKPLWIVQKSTLVAKFHNNFPILPQKDPENPLKMEISIENYHLVSKFPVLTGNSWVGGSSFSEIPVSRHMSTNLHKCPPPAYTLIGTMSREIDPKSIVTSEKKSWLWMSKKLVRIYMKTSVWRSIFFVNYRDHGRLWYGILKLW